MTDCLFCSKEIRARVDTETELIFAIPDVFPVTDGHMLIIPKRHVETYFDMSEAEHLDALAVMRKLKNEISEKDPSVSGFNVGMNCGQVSGQTVMHAHLHLIPRRVGDTDNPRGGVRGVIAEKQGY